MAEFPAFPIWTDALLADCEHLTDAEFGTYHRLLYYMWRSPAGKLPNDDDWLARKFRRSIDDVQNTVRPLVKEFCKTDGNWITQKRLQVEFHRARKQRRKATDNAKSRYSNNSRGRNSSATDKSVSSAGEHVYSNAPSSPSLSPSPSLPTLREEAASPPASEVEIENPKPRKARGTALPSDWELPPEWKTHADVERLRHALPEVDLDLEASKFRAHWRAKGAVMPEWREAWTKWVLDAKSTSSGAKSMPQINTGAVTSQVMTWEQRLKNHKPGGYWPQTWGPAPERDEHHDCPADLVAAWRERHGLAKRADASDAPKLKPLHVRERPAAIDQEAQRLVDVLGAG